MTISKYTLMCLRPTFRQKARQFEKQGYEKIEWEDIQRYFVEYAWKEKRPKTLPSQIKAIRSLTPNAYFDYAKLKATVYDVSPLDQMDIKNLF